MLTAAIESLESRYLLAGQHAVIPDIPVAGSITSLGASTAVSGVGQQVTFTATVTSFGNVVNSGSVTFKNGTTVIGSPSVVNGTASVMTSSLPAGTETIEADYSGSSTQGLATSSDTTTETVAYVVTTTDDNTIAPPAAGSLSLREAINLANQSTGPQTIVFDPTDFATKQTISLTLGQMEISNDMTIDGPSVGVILNGDSEFRIFDVDANETVSMDHLTISGGAVVGNGAGILTGSGSSLTLTDSTISSNIATGNSGNGSGGGIDASGALTIAGCLFQSNSATIDGGGIEEDGTMSLLNSTFEGNSASVGGGAIDNNNHATITNCTISGNSANSGGGIFSNAGGALTLNNTIIAKSTSGDDLTGNIASGSNNLIDDGNSSAISGLTNTFTGNPDLNAPADNGGPTFTMSLGSGSDALDHGSNALLPYSSEIQAVTVESEGSFTLSFNGTPTSTLFMPVSASSMQNALNSLPTIGGVGGSVVVTQNNNTYTVIFGGMLANQDLPQMIATGSSGANVTVSTITNGGPGFDQRGAGFPRIQGSSVDIGAFEEQVPATVSYVSSSTANASYGVGSAVTLNVGFSKPVNVTGTPRLALNSGGTAFYSSGSGTSTLTFTYTVAAGQNANPLDEASTSSLTLNGGTITDIDNNNAATLTLPAPNTTGSLGANKSIAVDTVAPGVANITSTKANGTYGIPASIDIEIAFSKPVVVTGTPELALNSGGTASYSGGSNSSTLTFTYTIGAGETATKLDAASTTALSLNGGTIFDTVTNPNAADLILPAPGTSGSLSANKSIRIAVAETPSLVVTTTSDVVDQFDGLTSLREAVNYANSLSGEHSITFDPSLAGQTISLGTDGDDTYGPSALAITGDMSIAGLDGPNGVTIDRDTAAAPDRLRLFYVAPGGTLFLQYLTISGGLAAGGDSQGGGGGAGLGGAIFNAGTLGVLNCTFDANNAKGGNSTAGSNLNGGGGGLGGSGSGNSGAPATGSNGLGGGGHAGIGTNGGAGGFGGGGGLTEEGEAGAGGFGGGAGGGLPGNPGTPGFGGGGGNDTDGQGGGGAGMGGAIFSNGGNVMLANTTFTANSATGGTGANPGEGLGGAIFNRDGTLNVANCTLSANTADQGSQVFSLGDGDHSGGDPVTLDSADAAIDNSILTQKPDPNAPPTQTDLVSTTNGVATASAVGTCNFINTDSGFTDSREQNGDPGLDALGKNGGPTETMALEPGSLAIDNGDNSQAKFGELLTTDQRGIGFARVMNNTVDIGAFEVQTPATVTSVSSTSANAILSVGGSVLITVTFNEPVTVTGTPELALNSGGTASYSSGSGSSTLTFGYSVAAGENADPLDEASTAALTLNGGTISDPAGNAATLTLPAPGATGSLSGSNIDVDTAAPTVINFDPGTSTGSVNSEIDYSITFSEPISGAASTDFDNTGTAPITIGTITGNGTDTLTVPVTATGTGTIILEINKSADVLDSAGNPLVVPVVDTHTVTIGVPDHAPTDIKLTPNSIPENADPPVAVGTLTDTDPDFGDTASYKLVSGTGSDNNNLFKIVNDLVVADVSFNYAVKNTYTIRVQVTDSAGMTFSKALTINVLDEAPQPHNDTASTTPDKAVTINVLANDNGPKGDTLSLVNNTNPANGTVTVSGNKYIYTPNTGFHGVDSFVYRIKDTHGVTATATVTITVGSGVGVGKDPVDSSITDLDIVGTSSADNIKVVYGGSQGKVQVFFGSKNEGTFNFTGRILIYGQGGNDTISVDSKITRTAIVWGDAGNDSITGGGGNDVLLGGSGNDKINGGDGRDILFGDDGSDSVNGGAGDDILIAGNASQEGNMAALAAWNKEWSRSDKNYSQRVSDITTGKGYAAGFSLNNTTVTSAPNPADTLTGSSGQDLFYANPTVVGGVGDLITDRVKTGSSAETLISVPS